jgi:hypothetical protein
MQLLSANANRIQGMSEVASIPAIRISRHNARAGNKA